MTFSIVPELSHNLQKFISAKRHSFSVHKHAPYTAESIVAVLALTFTLLHVVFDIKLRDSTGQVKVHKIKEKKETHKKEEKKGRK